MSGHRREGFPGESLVVLPARLREQLHKDRFCNGLYLTDIGYFPKASGHYVERIRGAKEYVIQFCLDGQGFCEFDGERHVLSRDQYVVFPPGKRHVYGSIDGTEWKVGWIHFLGTSAGVTVSRITSEGFGRPHSMSINKEWFNRFSDIVASLKFDMSYGNVAFNCTRLWTVFAELVYTGRIGATESSASPTERAIRYMQEHVKTQLTLPEIASHAGLSMSRFSVVFKEKTGVSPKEYFLGLKMQRACRYLSMTDWTIKDIAHELAFDDPYYFSRCFKQRMGVAPLHYRQENLLWHGEPE